MFNLSILFIYCWVCLGLQEFDYGIHNKADNTTLTIGIFPRRNPQVSYRMFKPLADYLSQRTGYKVNLVVSGDFKVFWHRVSSGVFDLVHFNQYQYLLAHKNWGYRVILKNEEFSSNKIGGCLYVRKDSGINKLTDLKGKKIVFGGGKQAMMGYILPSYMLYRAGLKPTDYKTEFSVTPNNAIYSVFYHQADAAASANIAIQMPDVRNNINTKKLKLLASSKRYVHFPWAVKKSMPRELARKIQLYLVDLKFSLAGIRILQQAGLTGLSKAKDKEYDPYRVIVRQLFGKVQE